MIKMKGEISTLAKSYFSVSVAIMSRTSRPKISEKFKELHITITTQPNKHSGCSAVTTEDHTPFPNAHETLSEMEDTTAHQTSF